MLPSESKQSTNIILTKCSKMSEEGYGRHGVNENVDRSLKEECPKSNYSQGGRLKFFKDGKFILELERAREGERVSWVSVPRKTFWPPHAAASSILAYRQESSTSLSDDNSSIQSSPWQRDHSWKQTTPVKNKSKELDFFFWRSKVGRKLFKGRAIKRRKPHVPLDPIDDNKVSVNREKRKKCSLLVIVQNLINENFRTITPPRPDAVVSPRKRFLREVENDKVQPDIKNSVDKSYNGGHGFISTAQKRSRCKPQRSSTPSPANTPPMGVIKKENSVSPPLQNKSNGIVDGTVVKPTRNCSYSITSLLADDRHSSTKHIPSHSPSQYLPTLTHISSASSMARRNSPSTAEDHLYSESVDRLRSIELSQVEKRNCPPYLPQHRPCLGGPYMYPFPPYYAPTIYSRSGYVIPPLYHHHSLSTPHNYLPPHHTHHAPTEGPPMTLAIYCNNGSSSTWNNEPPSVASDVDYRDDVSDMPLNLSKHMK
ncbi:uncharacterized protein LOC132705295 isoform X2 [Cylas formicarius]|uniref:uncharacterized protein LOC132705295 isoform X2 n=1 Tax=Cylas formicarius TaxID=197179 RepID=UPI002958DB15|nr:uncharacterized protein LOC132705295 isoform X2 [Cylas formicarius]